MIHAHHICAGARAAGAAGKLAAGIVITFLRASDAAADRSSYMPAARKDISLQTWSRTALREAHAMPAHFLSDICGCEYQPAMARQVSVASAFARFGALPAR